MSDRKKNVCIEIKDLHFSYEKMKKNHKAGSSSTNKLSNTSHTGNTQILDGITFSVKKNAITTLIGGNGCGKTTLFHLITRNLKMQEGAIAIDGKDITQFNHREFARKVAIVHQNNTATYDITVEDLIGYGRSPYISLLNPMTQKDRDIIEWAMEVTNVMQYRKRTVMSLSGGQRQRIWIAMALAQKTEILLLDEPTTYLDIRYQIELLEMIQKINLDYNITILMVLHDMNHAIYYSDQIIGMRGGNIVVDGPADEVINREVIHDIYDIELDVIEHEQKRIVIPVKI